MPLESLRILTPMDIEKSITFLFLIQPTVVYTNLFTGLNGYTLGLIPEVNLFIALLASFK